MRRPRSGCPRPNAPRHIRRIAGLCARCASIGIGDVGLRRLSSLLPCPLDRGFLFASIARTWLSASIAMAVLASSSSHPTWPARHRSSWKEASSASSHSMRRSGVSGVRGEGIAFIVALQWNELQFRAILRHGEGPRCDSPPRPDAVAHRAMPRFVGQQAADRIAVDL